MENPGAIERRVALLPPAVRRLSDYGVKVYVEAGAGDGLGVADAKYAAAGATVQNHEEIYQRKDMIVKFKGPPLEAITRMAPGSTLFCMAHFHSFPDRAKLLVDHKINVVAMEEILESPKKLARQLVLGKVAMKSFLAPYAERDKVHELDIRFLGWSERLVGAIRRAGNRSPHSLAVLAEDIRVEELDVLGENAVYFYDSLTFADPQKVLPHLEQKGCVLFDLQEFEAKDAREAMSVYFCDHTPYEFGKRRIECLRETGQAGARYGFKLLREQSSKSLMGDEVRAIVLGYGNVGMGAIQECFEQGVRITQILTRYTTNKERIDPFLKDADLVVNGADQPKEVRGKNYLITADHTKNVFAKGTVVIDLVGGSAVNRSPVEDILECTYLDDPYFEREGILFSAVWGWPMVGMANQSCIRYSHQIVDVLLDREKLIEGLGGLSPGIKRALLTGPFPLETLGE